MHAAVQLGWVGPCPVAPGCVRTAAGSPPLATLCIPLPLLQASFFASLVWASFLIILMAFFFQGSDKTALTVLLWTGEHGAEVVALADKCACVHACMCSASLIGHMSHHAPGHAPYGCQPAPPTAGLLFVIPLTWTVLWFRVRHAHKVSPAMTRQAISAGLLQGMGVGLPTASMADISPAHPCLGWSASAVLCCGGTMPQVALKYRAALKTGKPVIHKFYDELEVEVSRGC